MLVEIKSDIFRNKAINFHAGLNIVLGDEEASNSIGKSNLLLIVDFVFGGDTYLTHSSDVVHEISHHAFYFSFKFNKNHNFKRTTNDPNNVYVCDDQYEIIKSISLEDYTKFLQTSYDINYLDSTFRSLVGLYLRVWGKNNDDIRKPLKTYKDDANEKLGIDNLIKLFNKYTELKEINDNITKNTFLNKTIIAMYKSDYAHKITKTTYKRNQIEIENISSQIEDIKKNILKYVINVEELIDQEVIQLKKQKEKLLVIKDNYNNRIMRINKNLESESNISQKHLVKLHDFFPNSNIKQIDEIEKFHTKLKSILASEIKKNKIYLQDELSLINNEIEEISNQITSHYEMNDNPKIIIDKVYELTIKLNDIKNINKVYEEKESKVLDIKTGKEELFMKSETIINDIQDSINKKMHDIYLEIYKNTNSPIINIEKNKYILEKPHDTGTGAGYMNLIIFDLSILQLTNLPIIAHDSILFKNIENSAMENLIQFYNKSKKQIFIAIDEYKKYTQVIPILEKQKVIQLDKENVLFTKKWSKKTT